MFMLYSGSCLLRIHRVFMTSMGWFTTNWRSAYVFAIDAMETCMKCFWYMLLHVEDVPGITLGEGGLHSCTGQYEKWHAHFH